MNVVSPGEWPRHRFVIMNECRMHNHATESAGKKTGVKNIPNDGPVAHMVATPHDCNVSSEKIGGFMSEELGNWSNALLKLQNGGTAQSRPQTFANGILAKNASSMKHRGSRASNEEGVPVPSSVPASQNYLLIHEFRIEQQSGGS
ncbi:hypothetical protein PC128_g4723 [Phytophthora cactorum]|nr:hypothetical protein PC128_g4723 [Phytophthora cactorum]